METDESAYIQAFLFDILGEARDFLGGHRPEAKIMSISQRGATLIVEMLSGKCVAVEIRPADDEGSGWTRSDINAYVKQKYGTLPPRKDDS